MRSLILTITLLWGGSFFAQQAIQPDLSLLTDYMIGDFSSSEQAKNDSDYVSFDLHTRQIWNSESDDVWLYVEQISSDTPDQPYRQRVYRVTQLGKNKFASFVYDIPEKELWAGLWKKPRRAKRFDSKDLSKLEGCAIGIHHAEGVFKGATSDRCESSWGGASLATSEVRIEADRMILWDRGWDDTGKQVWGASKGGYIFIKD